jgi:HAD superfamily hydrolase (TIGR01509 family)
VTTPTTAAVAPSLDPAPPIRALIFDMDGLLVDSEPLAARALEQFLREHGHAIRPDTMARTLGRRLPEAIALLAESYALTAPLPDLVATYDRLRLAALRGNLRPMPGAAALLAFARDAGLRLALATSSLRSHADLTLTETALAGLFDAEATGDEVAHGKPAPDIFLLAARRLGVPPAHCVVLEDAPAGLAAAAAAGMRRLWVPNDATRGLPTPVPVDAELPDLLAAIPWLNDQDLARPLPPMAATGE